MTLLENNTKSDKMRFVFLYLYLFCLSLEGIAQTAPVKVIFFMANFDIGKGIPGSSGFQISIVRENDKKILVSGKIVDEEGRDVKGAIVEVKISDQIQSTVTDHLGNYTIAITPNLKLPSSTVEIKVKRDNCRHKEIVEMPQNDTIIKNLKINCNKYNSALLPLKSYYFIGCGLGQKISLLPRQEGNVFLDNFLDILKSVEEFESIYNQLANLSETIIKTNDKEYIKSLTKYFYHIANQMPALIEKVAQPSQYDYFLLGNLIHDIAQTQATGAVNIPRDKEKNVQYSELIAIKERIDIPENIKKEIDTFIKVAKREDSYFTSQQAQKITKMIMSL